MFTTILLKWRSTLEIQIKKDCSDAVTDERRENINVNGKKEWKEKWSHGSDFKISLIYHLKPKYTFSPQVSHGVECECHSDKLRGSALLCVIMSWMIKFKMDVEKGFLFLSQRCEWVTFLSSPKKIYFLLLRFGAPKNSSSHTVQVSLPWRLSSKFCFLYTYLFFSSPTSGNEPSIWETWKRTWALA